MPPSPHPSSVPVRVGLAGYGGAGRVFHAPALRSAGDVLDLVAVASSHPERVASLARDLPEVQVVPDLDALLDVPDLDLVIIATPTGMHAAQAQQVIGAGIAVVVDKPLGRNASEALEVVSVAAHEGVPLTVFQNRRYDPELPALVRVRDDALVGDLRRAEYRWDRWRPVPRQRWRETQTPAEGAGLLLDLQTHLLDQAVLLHGEVESVYAELDARTTVAEDDTFLACRHTSGVVSHVIVNAVNGAPGPRARVMGSTGSYVIGRQFDETSAFHEFDNVSDAAGEHVGWIVRGDEREPGPVVGPSDQGEFYRQVAIALRSDDPQGRMPVDPRDAVHVLAVIDAARVSARDHRVVEVVTPGQSPD